MTGPSASSPSPCGAGGPPPYDPVEDLMRRTVVAVVAVVLVVAGCGPSAGAVPRPEPGQPPQSPVSAGGR